MFSKIALSFTTLLIASASLAPLAQAQTQFGQVKMFVKANKSSEATDDKVFWISPGKSFCGPTYRDDSEVACLKNDWVDKDKDNACGRFISITSGATNVTTQAQLLEKCGDVKGSTFGVNDLYVSWRTFKKLSGNNYKANKVIGNLQTSVKWEWVVESCQGCASGILARDEHSRVDNCTGKDSQGFARCGRKKGDERALTQAAVDKVCNSDYQCPLPQ